ncbi:hypothetical protein [Alteraurantiacibacter aquimixticola]|uniref:Uncharacterized protein n=1 Tax=Alteraurantiacibacter aquimixticola TaxID=2489173 RepID=A0A4T3F266_9SPHN|nr:hypothetical protein [Alteraurantiacibacter aquimixticola]TIX51266.1 hypothetical protein E5222_02020 [Alteraurantiacibacter aquimixticola]
MHHEYRIEYLSCGNEPGRRMAIPVPDVRTALIVAEINMPGGSAELWDGDRQIARLQRRPGTRSAFWHVS